MLRAHHVLLGATLLFVSPMGASDAPLVSLDGPGWVALAVLPDENMQNEVEVTWTSGAYSVYGSMYYELDDPSDVWWIGDPEWGSAGLGGLAYDIELNATGHHSHTFIRNGPWFTHGVSQSWDWEPIGHIFWAAGNMSQFDVSLVGGEVVGLAYGTEALSGWAYQLDGGDGHVVLRTPATGSDGVRFNETLEFETNRPFFGRVQYSSTTGSVQLEGPDGARDCPCLLTPQETTAGAYTVRVNGYGPDGKVFWAFSPDLPTGAE